MGFGIIKVRSPRVHSPAGLANEDLVRDLCGGPNLKVAEEKSHLTASSVQ
jgi:hypothetical protein